MCVCVQVYREKSGRIFSNVSTAATSRIGDGCWRRAMREESVIFHLICFCLRCIFLHVACITFVIKKKKKTKGGWPAELKDAARPGYLKMEKCPSGFIRTL